MSVKASSHHHRLAKQGVNAARTVIVRLLVKSGLISLQNLVELGVTMSPWEIMRSPFCITPMPDTIGWMSVSW